MNVNTATRRLVDENLNTLNWGERPNIVYGDGGILEFDLVDKDNNPFVALEEDTWEFFADIDYVHETDEGTLANGYSGAVTEIVVTGLTADFENEGYLLLTNSANERDRVAYTAYDSGTGTFTVSTTLVNTYLAGDTCAVEDQLCIYSTDWNSTDDRADADPTTGKLCVRYDALTTGFRDKITSTNTRLKIEIRRHTATETRPQKLLLDEISASPTIASTEGAPSTNDPDYGTIVANDARYVRSALSTAYSEQSTVLGTERIFVRDGSTSKQTTIDKISTYVGTVFANTFLSKTFFSYSQKTTPVDADTLAINDSADSLAPKYLAWANVKATLKTYFDTLYLTATSVLDYLQFNTSVSTPAYSEGKIFYDATNKTFTFYDDILDTSVQIAQEVFDRILNNTGSKIPNGSPVYIDGASSGNPTMQLASCGTYDTSRIIGIATHDIPDKTVGKASVIGRVNDIDTTAFSEGDVVYLGETAGTLVNTQPTGRCFICQVGVVLSVGATTGSIILNISTSELAAEISSEGGFPDNDEVVITWDDVTRTLTLTPDDTDYHYYIQGNQFITTGDTLVLPDTTGTYWCYYDDDVLTYAYNPSSDALSVIIRTKATVAVVQWNATEGEAVYVGWEPHCSIGYGAVNHAYEHFTTGARYVRDGGLAVGDLITDGNGSLATHAQFSTTTGGIVDEDLFILIMSKAVGYTYPIAYIGADGLTIATQTGYPVLRATDRLYYNDADLGTLVEVGSNNDYVLCHLFANNSLDTANRIFAVMGQEEYISAGNARDGALTEITNLKLLFPTPEFFPIASILYQTGSYGNAVNARIRPLEDAYGNSVDYLDWRYTAIGGGTSAGGTLSAGDAIDITADVVSVDISKQADVTSFDDTDMILIEKTTGEIQKIYKTDLAGGGGGLTWSAITNDATAVSGNGYQVDSSSNTVTLTLPLTPSNGDKVGFVAIDITNTVTIARNGKNIFETAEDLVIDIESSGFTLVYNSSTTSWEIVTEINGGSATPAAVIPINAQTGTTYTMVIEDAGKLITMNNSSANTVTIPLNSSVAFKIGSLIVIDQIGSGATTIEGATGVTVNGTSGGSEAISAQWLGASLKKLGTDTWIIQGGI